LQITTLGLAILIPTIVVALLLTRRNPATLSAPSPP
jgi:hypothetical protein